MVVWRGEYLPFGGVFSEDRDPDGDGVEVEQPFRFPGQYGDDETGLYYNYFRDYDPSLGRYTEADPIGLAGGVNLYLYADQNILNEKDIWGLYVSGIGGGIAGAVTGNVSSGVSGAANCSYYWDQDGNKAVICSASFGLAGGAGIVGGLQVSNLWGYDTVCDLASGVGFALGAGGGVGPGLTAEINEKGITTISGVGVGGWGGAVTVAQGIKVLWSSGPCFDAKECD